MISFSPQIFLSVWLALLSLIGPAAASPAQTESPAQIYLQNVPIQDEQLLVVNLSLANVSDLYGAEVQLSYDPAQLKVRDDNRRLEGIQISPGPLIASDNRFVVTNAANPDGGIINFVFTLLKPAPAISGKGELATVVFEIIGDGPYEVEITHAQLVSSQLESIPASFQNLRLNHSLEPETAPPAGLSRFSMGQWMASVGVVGLFGVLVALIVVASRRKATVPPESTQSPIRKKSGGARSNIRSAALLAEQGMKALEGEDDPQAYELFSRAIELDPANVEAWLGRGLMAQQTTEKRICLQRVLALDPNNKKAKAELEKLRGRIG